LVVVGWLAAVRDELLTDVPLGVERDPSGQVAGSHLQCSELDERRRRARGSHPGFAVWLLAAVVVAVLSRVFKRD
jgi:hypothetical protein